MEMPKGMYLRKIVRERKGHQDERTREILSPVRQLLAARFSILNRDSIGSRKTGLEPATKPLGKVNAERVSPIFNVAEIHFL